MATEPSQSPLMWLDSGSQKRPREPGETAGEASASSTGPARKQPGEVFHSDSSGPQTPNYGDEECTGPPSWEVGEECGGKSELDAKNKRVVFFFILVKLIKIK